MNGLNPSGLYVYQFDNTTLNASLNGFFGYTAAGTAAPAAGSPSMQTLFGINNTAELEMFAYASKIDFRFVVPLANLTGTMYRGTLRLGQFFKSNTADQGTLELAVSDLIRAADHIEGMKTEFSLQSSIVNDYILTHTLKTGGEVVTNYLQDNDLGAEVIDYVILQTPAINITTGAASTFSLIAECFTNIAVMPSAKNLLLYRTFDTISHRKQLKEIDYPYSPVDASTLSVLAPPSDYKNLSKWEVLVSNSDQDKNISASETRLPQLLHARNDALHGPREIIDDKPRLLQEQEFEEIKTAKSGEEDEPFYEPRVHNRGYAVA